MNDKKILAEYQMCVNKIEDYFEYSYQSEDDKQYVIDTIDHLLAELLRINKEADQ